MELEELKTVWIQHEKMLLENTVLNKKMLRKLLILNAEKRIDWLKIRTLSTLILPLIGVVFIVMPRIQFILKFDAVLGLVLFGSTFIVSYIWAVRLYLLVEKLNFHASVVSVSKQLRQVEKYKLKITRHGLMLAPFMIVGIFLSAGIPFLSSKMIPFYTLMLIVFLISTYIRTKHGLVARLRKLEKDLEEISELERDIA
jgi:hypothetical protein